MVPGQVASPTGSVFEAPTVIQSASSSSDRRPSITTAEQARAVEPLPESVTRVQKISHVYPAEYGSYFWEPNDIDIDGGLNMDVVVNQFDMDNLDSVSAIYSGNLEEGASVLLGRHVGAEH
eukprot:8242711-Karenia_brevis.AAC.1